MSNYRRFKWFGIFPHNNVPHRWAYWNPSRSLPLYYQQICVSIWALNIVTFVAGHFINLLRVTSYNNVAVNQPYNFLVSKINVMICWEIAISYGVCSYSHFHGSVNEKIAYFARIFAAFEDDGKMCRRGFHFSTTFHLINCRHRVLLYADFRLQFYDRENLWFDRSSNRII